jgi:hypothetical protein
VLATEAANALRMYPKRTQGISTTVVPPCSTTWNKRGAFTTLLYLPAHVRNKDEDLKCMFIQNKCINKHQNYSALLHTRPLMRNKPS